ncbi:MAG: hypothetical protein COB30_020880 [Ectothiorhodospiraceae bacterium]|nr:hypothetical protein [Ectothiorhodospiraceae bacterium]
MENAKILDQFRKYKISSSTISDILDTLDVDCVLSNNLKRMTGSSKYVAGFAYTVEWGPVKKKKNITEKGESTWDQIKGFINIPNGYGKDNVYVSGSGELMRDAALAGGISINFFKSLGFEMVLLGGAVRDYEQLTNVDIPVVASNWTPADTQGFYKVKSVEASCRIENTIINTGDIIISDMTGTVCIPYAFADHVLEHAILIESSEHSILELVKKGISPIDAVESLGRI